MLLEDDDLPYHNINIIMLIKMDDIVIENGWRIKKWN